MISVLIPSRNEKYLNRTIDDIYRQFRGKFEVIVVLDGYTDYPVSRFYSNLHIIENEKPLGIRTSINQAVANSKGNCLLKVDAHVGFDEGFDVKLRMDCEEDQVMVARRYTLDLDSWKKYSRNVDYFYLSCPWTHKHSFMMQSCPWISYTEAHMDKPIDDLMCFQGSMWMMSRNHWDWIGGLTTDMEYAEHHEISMKTWLGGRKVVINKNTWYAHPSKNTGGYHMSINTVYRDHDRSARYWTENRWNGRVHDFEWLINKFWPLPFENTRHKTEKYYWPEEWRTYCNVVS